MPPLDVVPESRGPLTCALVDPEERAVLHVRPPVGVLVGWADAGGGRRELAHDLGVQRRHEVDRPHLRHQVPTHQGTTVTHRWTDQDTWGS